MRLLRRSLFRLPLCVGFLSLSAVFGRAGVTTETTAAIEAQAALDKLHATTYRQKDIMVGALAAMGAAAAPVVTEHAGDRTRLVSEISIPNLGSMRTERVTSGSRAAVRITAPALLAKLEQAKAKLTVSAARSLLQQIVSAASAVQSGGLSAASWIAEATRAAMTIRSTAEARVALDNAIAGFQSWQPVVEDEDMASLPSPPEGGRDLMKVEKTINAAGTIISYRRTPAEMSAGGFYSVLLVDAETSLPIAEENYVNGQRIMRSEFFDIGAPITIELPLCLGSS
jgi:hypothetical protein